MRNIMKATTLESKFPLLAVEHGCILSKDADITAAFELELPEVYTLTGEEYEAIHGAKQSRYCPITRYCTSKVGT